MHYKKIASSSFFVLMESGENINQILTTLARTQGWTSASFSGIGAVKDVTLGYFDSKSDKYIQNNFNGEYELLSCSGNISILDGSLFAHIHAVVADAKYHTYGGHLVSSKISVTGEFFVNIFNEKLSRVKNGSLGLITLGEDNE